MQHYLSGQEGQRATAKHFCIDHSAVRKWIGSQLVISTTAVDSCRALCLASSLSIAFPFPTVPVRIWFSMRRCSSARLAGWFASLMPESLGFAVEEGRGLACRLITSKKDCGIKSTMFNSLCSYSFKLCHSSCITVWLLLQRQRPLGFLKNQRRLYLQLYLSMR